MQSDNASPFLITTQTLSYIDNIQLIDLLQHRTKLMITARVAKLADKDYIESLRKEVVDIQTEIKSRMN